MLKNTSFTSGFFCHIFFKVSIITHFVPTVLAGKGIIWIVQPLSSQWNNILATKISILPQKMCLVWSSTTPEITLGNIFMGNVDATRFFLWAPGIMPPILVTRATAAVPVYCWHFSWLNVSRSCCWTHLVDGVLLSFFENICAKQLGSFSQIRVTVTNLWKPLPSYKKDRQCTVGSCLQKSIPWKITDG